MISQNIVTYSSLARKRLILWSLMPEISRILKLKMTFRRCVQWYFWRKCFQWSSKRTGSAIECISVSWSRCSIKNWLQAHPLETHPIHPLRSCCLLPSPWMDITCSVHGGRGISEIIIITTTDYAHISIMKSTKWQSTNTEKSRGSIAVWTFWPLLIG